MNIAGSAKAIIPAGRDALRAATYLLEFLILAVTYFGLTAALSLLPSINVVATPLWPPSGFALSLVLLRGERIIPALLAGICAFHVMVGSSFISSAVAGIGTLIASMAGARLLNIWSDGRMPTNACQFFYDCTGCGRRLKPKPGDCCVFCSYGSVCCPPMQAKRSGEPNAGAGAL